MLHPGHRTAFSRARRTPRTRAGAHSARLPITALLLALAACRGMPLQVSHPALPMRDGTRIAADVLLPGTLPAGGVPTVLIQTRYWRSFHLRGRRGANALPVVPREPIARELLAAGFAVVVTDVRGTGASSGTWRWPWSAEEVADGGEVIDWIARQPWSNGAVGATGVSYEGTTALLALTTRHPALRAVLAREIEWQLADETLAPGGVRNVGFIDSWSRSATQLDRGGWPELFPGYARWLVHGVQPVDGDRGRVALAALQRERPDPAVALALRAVRSGGDRYGPGGPPVDSLAPSGHAAALRASTAAVGVWGSWWDGATADAVFRADAGMPLVEAVIGPWTHEGDANASPLARRDSERPVVALADVVAFFRRHLGAPGTRTSAPAAPARRWYVAGAERWREGAAWPVASPRRYALSDSALAPANAGPRTAAPRTLRVDFAATSGRDTRWTTPLARGVRYNDRRAAAGVLAWTGAPLDASLGLFGAAQLRCPVTVAREAAALHVYLEAVEPDGRVRLLTEGAAVVRTGVADVRLRPVAAELPAGWRMRVAVAGADAPTFERIPALGDQTLGVGGTGCEVTLPVVPTPTAPLR